MNYQLLCTFSLYNQTVNTISDIISKYDIINNKIYIYEALEDRDSLYCTYNIVPSKKNKTFLDNTILVHTKRKTNTFYTINALNILIREINNGVLDTSYLINWDNYENMLILYNNNELKKIKLELREVFNMKSKEDI